MTPQPRSDAHHLHPHRLEEIDSRRKWRQESRRTFVDKWKHFTICVPETGATTVCKDRHKPVLVARPLRDRLFKQASKQARKRYDKDDIILRHVSISDFLSDGQNLNNVWSVASDQSHTNSSTYDSSTPGVLNSIGRQDDVSDPRARFGILTRKSPALLPHDTRIPLFLRSATSTVGNDRLIKQNCDSSRDCLGAASGSQLIVLKLNYCPGSSSYGASTLRPSRLFINTRVLGAHHALTHPYPNHQTRVPKIHSLNPSPLRYQMVGKLNTTPRMITLIGVIVPITAEAAPTSDEDEFVIWTHFPRKSNG